MTQSFNQYSENETKIWCQNILNQFNRVSLSCLRSHFVISLISMNLNGTCCLRLLKKGQNNRLKISSLSKFCNLLPLRSAQYTTVPYRELMLHMSSQMSYDFRYSIITLYDKFPQLHRSNLMQ